MNLCDIQTGMNLSGFYLLKQASLRTTAAGKPYLAGLITDRTGTVELKVWDYSGPINHEDEGKIACLVGRVSEFKGALQVTADRIRLAQDNDNYDLSLLVPTAPLPPPIPAPFLPPVAVTSPPLTVIFVPSI